jgi:DeoR/GlpR family transcriptional regulator of sugar metabolism
MFVEERQQRILQLLRDKGKVTVEELAADFGVSAPTVRSDLASLELRRMLRRTHGGALPTATSLYEPPFAEREGEWAEEKRRIGRAAAELVQPGETILLDAGTTTHEVGVALAASGKTGITVVTNNLPTVMALMDAPGIDVVVIGGQVQPRRRAMLGPLATDFLKPFRCDRLFLGVSGVDPRAGLTAVDFDAVQIKRAMIAHSQTVVVVADSAKIGQASFAHVAPLSAVHLLITDSDLTEDAERNLRDAGIADLLRVGLP